MKIINFKLTVTFLTATNSSNISVFIFWAFETSTITLNVEMCVKLGNFVHIMNRYIGYLVYKRELNLKLSY